ncbi:hypothetical protein ABS767_08300 [Sphingomonas sp. ST-64]|uniref:Uncharacterized protein n=1 Tax=Sphingomonas plantiphila TaxID=3163295 RepID=A0ABW8YL32_9SPHN
MFVPASLLRFGSVAAQALLVLGGAGVLALYPPREGALILFALDGRDAGRLVQPAIDAGVEIAGRGPLGNMLIVRGERRRLAPLVTGGVLILAAPAIWCGADRQPS